MHNGGNHNNVIKEAGKFLKGARELEQKEANDGEFRYGQLEIPMMVIRSIVPKVPGQENISVFELALEGGRKTQSTSPSV